MTMDKSKTLTSQQIDDLLEDMIVDAHGDAEQLTAMQCVMEEDLGLPVDVFVAGTPMYLVGIDYDGNSRRGLVAQCVNGNGTLYKVAFADVQMPVIQPAHGYLSAYCRWLGIEPMAPPAPIVSSGASAYSKAANDIDVTKPVELIVLVVKERAVRCRQLDHQKVITLKASEAFKTVPGLVISVELNKSWQFKGHPYLSGRIVSTRVDAGALGLRLLEVDVVGAWDPAEAYAHDEENHEDTELVDDAIKAIIARGPRPLCAMQQVLPGFDTDDLIDVGCDPIIEANELREKGANGEAQQLLYGLLEADLRCLDAHAHLGSMAFDSLPRRALDHYEVGVKIGELALGDSFQGVLSWHDIDNRPFLRCLHGYGLCLWKLARFEDSAKVFRRILELNPMDEMDINTMLPEVLAHQPYHDHEV